MSEEQGFEVPLSREEVRRVLALCAADGLLVGGQALAFWADHYSVPRPADLASGVTADVDFIGDSMLARDLGRQLGWKTWIPSLDEATPQTGKVTHRQPDGGVKQVDFLSGVVGLTTKDLQRRASELDVPGIGRLRVIDPVDVLDSRIQNLDLLREKRTPGGIAQGKLAVAVARAHIRDLVRTETERVALKALERVADIAADPAAVRVFLRHGIDPLEAIPIDEFRTTPALQARRWPQIREEVARKREAAQRTEAERARGLS